jgi:hypothetical protein
LSGYLCLHRLFTHFLFWISRSVISGFDHWIVAPSGIRHLSANDWCLRVKMRRMLLSFQSLLNWHRNVTASELFLRQQPLQGYVFWFCVITSVAFHCPLKAVHTASVMQQLLQMARYVYGITERTNCHVRCLRLGSVDSRIWITVRYRWFAFGRYPWRRRSLILCCSLNLIHCVIVFAILDSLHSQDKGCLHCAVGNPSSEILMLGISQTQALRYVPITH